MFCKTRGIQNYVSIVLHGVPILLCILTCMAQHQFSRNRVNLTTALGPNIYNLFSRALCSLRARDWLFWLKSPYEECKPWLFYYHKTQLTVKTIEHSTSLIVTCFDTKVSYQRVHIHTKVQTNIHYTYRYIPQLTYTAIHTSIYTQ
jgi:hypothetical protein